MTQTPTKSKREQRSASTGPVTSGKHPSWRMSPLGAIRKHCIECCGTYQEVGKCCCPDCVLWPFRFGLRPETAAKHGKPVNPDTFVTETELLAEELGL